MNPSVPPLRHPERAAHASIRGYLFQVVGIARRWMALDASTILVCEANEDADEYLVDPSGVVQAIVEVQYKDIEGKLSVRNEEVQSTLFNFLRAFHVHHQASTPARFVFTTSAARARQVVGAADSANVNLATDVLRTWIDLNKAKDRRASEAALTADVCAVATAAKPKPAADGKATKADADYADVLAAIAYLNADPARWSAFLAAVDWTLDDGGIGEQRSRLADTVAADARTREFPAALFAERLVVRVLERSSHAEVGMRTLRRSDLEALAKLSSEELEKWAASVRAERLAQWLSDVEGRVDGLTLAVAEHEARLDRAADEPLARLKRQSARYAHRLSSTFASLTVQGRSVRLVRPVVAAAAASALAQSLIIVGDAGAGKSGVLSGMIDELQAGGHDVIVLAADAAEKLGDDLVDTLERWTGTQPGVVIVDALDSIRDDTRGGALRRVLTEIVTSGGRWHVVASIRAFDLQRGSAMATLFAGAPPTPFADARFAGVRHVAVRSLTDEELASLAESAPDLHALVQSAGADLRTLLRVPFYLSLAVQLLDGGVVREAFALVRTRLELFDLYWARRIADEAVSKEERERLLHDVCDRMVASRRMEVPKADLRNATRLGDLLSSNVLAEPPSTIAEHDERFVAFSHHLLFDYAIARLWVPQSPAELAERLKADPQLLVFGRPSIAMAFEILWARDPERRLFWGGVLHLAADSSLRDVGKIVGPSVAASSVAVSSDLSGLLAALHDGARAPAADRALAFVVAALGESRAVAGPTGGPWASFTAALAGIDRPATLQSMWRLLSRITADPTLLTDAQRAHAGTAARALWTAAHANGDTLIGMAREALRSVCRTAASDPAASAAIVRSAFSAESLAADGHVLVPAVAREIEWLFSDAALTRDVYVVAFSFEEGSDERTSLSSGVVFGLSSNRRQDYESGLTLLATAFPQFLRAAPEAASQALFGVLEAYVRHDRLRFLGEPDPAFAIPYGRETIAVASDDSAYWEGRTHVEELAMLDAWQNFVAEIAARPEKIDRLKELFLVTVSHNRVAVVWSRWLRLAVTAPDSVGPLVLPLLESAEVLAMLDLAHDAVECVRAIFGRQPEDARRRIETAILAAVSREADVRSADDLAARFLSAAGETSLQSREAVALLREVYARGAVSKNPPPFVSRRLVRGERRDPDQYLKEQGVDLATEPNRALRAATQALEAAQKTLGASADDEAALLELAETAADALIAPNASRAHALIVDDVWGAVAAAAVALTDRADSATAPSWIARLSRVARLVATCPSPRPTITTEDGFREAPSWGTPRARGDVVRVLFAMRERGIELHANEAALSDLAFDDHPAVRFEVARLVGHGVAQNPAWVWRTAGLLVAGERNPGVLKALVAETLAALSGDEPARVSLWAGCLLARIRWGKGAEGMRDMAYRLLAELHLYRATPPATRLVLDAALRPDSNDARTLAICLRPLLATPSSNKDEAYPESARLRARLLLDFLVTGAASALAVVQREYAGLSMPADVVKDARGIVSLLDTCAKEIYFASGAFDAKQDKRPLEASTDTRMFEELAPIMDRIAEAGVPSAVHTVNETAAYFLPHYPARALAIVTRAALAGERAGYHYDSMAVELVVAVARRVLEDHRALLQGDPGLQAMLLDLLDLFVRAGWSEAYAVTYELQDVYR